MQDNTNQINEIKFYFATKKYILHKQTKRKVLFHGGHMAHFVLSSCDPKHKLRNDIYIYIIYIYIYILYIYIYIYIYIQCIMVIINNT